MRVAAHVFRRGAVYTWRRRIPLACGINLKSPYIQLSLRTRDPEIARHLGAVLHGESARVFEQISSNRLTLEDAKTWLEEAVTSELARIRDRRLAAMETSDPAERADDLLLDELAGHAYRLLAHHGGSAVFAPEEDVDIAARGFTEEKLRRGRDLMETLRRDFWSDSRHARTRAEYERVLGQKTMPALLYLELRRLKLEGRAIAYLASLADDDQRDLQPDVDATKANILQQNREAGLIFKKPESPKETAVFAPADEAPQEVPLEHASTNPAAEGVQDNSYTRCLLDVTARLIEKKRKAGTQKKTLAQITQIMEALVEITGVTQTDALRQHHISRYIDTLGDLPKSYRKSPKDHDKPISYFLELGKSLPPDKKGLSANTINRNLGFLGMVLKRAIAEGHAVDARIDLTGLREKKTRSDRDEWRAFTPEDVQTILSNPLWTGFKSIHRRRKPGNQTLKDAHFWVPVIAALSGARREEIAALAPQDVREIDDIWCFDIRANALRGVKNNNATRIVPVHSQLIELGLLNRVRDRQGGPDLFPELRPNQEKSSYGDQLDYVFRNVVKDQLEDRERKSFHSFRHYVVDVLTNLPDLRPEHRDDILGHQGRGMGATRYGSGTNITNRKAVIERLPRITALEGL